MKLREMTVGQDYYCARLSIPWVEMPGERVRYLGQPSGAAAGKASGHLVSVQRVTDDGTEAIGEPEDIRGMYLHGTWEMCSAVRAAYVEQTTARGNPEQRALTRIVAAIRERTGESLNLTPDASPRRFVRLPVDVLIAMMDPKDAAEEMLSATP